MYVLSRASPNLNIAVINDTCSCNLNIYILGSQNHGLTDLITAQEVGQYYRSNAVSPPLFSNFGPVFQGLLGSS